MVAYREEPLTKPVMELALRGIPGPGHSVIPVRGTTGTNDGFFLFLYNNVYKIDILRSGGYEVHLMLDKMPIWLFTTDDGTIDRKLVASFTTFEEVLKFFWI
jgi:hypothetical protein